MSAERLQAVLDLENQKSEIQCKLDAAIAELPPDIRLRLYGARPQTVAIEALDKYTGAVLHKFPSLSAAAKFGFDSPSIAACLDGKAQSHRNLFWRRAGETAVPQAKPVVDRTPYLKDFIATHVHEAPGVLLPFGEFYDRFIEWLPEGQRRDWSRKRVGRSMPIKFPSGTGNQNKTYIINAAFEPGQRGGRPYCIASEGRIKRAD